MSCRYENNVNNKPSILFDDLVEKLGNEDDAAKILAYTQSEEFISVFGNYVNPTKYSKEMASRLKGVEPELFTKKGLHYFILEDGTKDYVNPTLANFNYKQKKALITNGISYLMGGADLTSREDIINLNFKNLEKPRHPESGKVNPVYLLMDGNAQAIREIGKSIANYIGTIAYNPTDREELGSEMNIDETENGYVIDLRQSMEKNSKDNASANIKFLLSFIPKVNKDNQFEKVSFTAPDGTPIKLNVLYDFNEIWNTFEETLAGIYPTFNGQYVQDVYETMITKMQSEFSDNLSVQWAIERLLKNIPDWKKNQFVQAFIKSKNNFYTTKISEGDSGALKITFMDSGDTTSRTTKLRQSFAYSIKNSVLYNITNQTVNEANVNTMLERFSNMFDRVIADDLDKFEVVNLLKPYIEKVGIYVNDNAIANYIDSFENTKGDNIELALSRFNDMLKEVKKNSFFDEKGFKLKKLANETFIKNLANEEAAFRKDVNENNVLGADGKKYWSYSLPNYLNVKLRQYIDNYENEINRNGFYQTSFLLDAFNDEEKNKFIDFITFLNLRKEVGDEGVDNKSISKNDQFIDLLNKAVMQKQTGDYVKNPNSVNIYNTLAPADKGRSLGLKSTEFFPSNIFLDADSKSYLIDSNVINQYKNYTYDEYVRISQELKKLDTLKPEDTYNHYHTKKGQKYKTIESGPFEGKQIPVGNAFKFTLLDSLNPIVEGTREEVSSRNKPIHSQLFNLSSEGTFMKPVMTREEFMNNPIITSVIQREINKTLEKHINYLSDAGLIAKTDSKVNNKFTGNPLVESLDVKNVADRSAYNTYFEEYNDITSASLNFLGDSILNQHLHNIEYAKAFTGDYAFYKNLDDFSKRIPATYVDGLMINLQPEDDPKFNMMVLPEHIVESEYIPNYDDVDGNDAQGYITLDRWEFLMKRLNKWSPEYDQALERMKNGTSTDKDHKYAAQPLKGVYFDVIDGVPTYVKYSQGVLIPNVVEGSNLENLYNTMNKKGVDEAVALSGVKVGAQTVSNVLDENGDFTTNTDEVYIKSLNNHAWRLQQDLSPKGVKPTLLGSQVQKNILQNLVPTKKYNGRTGKDLVESTENTISDLSNLYLKRLEQEIGLNALTGVITDEEAFRSGLLKEAARNADINTIEALEKNYSLDVIINNRNKYQNLIASMVNNATVKIKTNGASFIQMSAHGWNMKDAKKAGVKMLVEDTELKPPRIEGNKVKPGQVFISHQQIIKHIPNYRDLDMEELNDMIDSRLLEIVGYRIPNQDLASSDALEIVGILPSSMGDTIVPYIEITKKTGSDFDIDKMYAMIPNIYASYTQNTYKEAKKYVRDLGLSKQEMIDELMEIPNVAYGDLSSYTEKELVQEFVEELVFGGDDIYSTDFRAQYPTKIDRLEFLDESNAKGNQAKVLENKLMRDYIHILTSKELYKDLTKPLDSDVLPNDLELLHGQTLPDSGFDFFSSMYQLQKKFDNAAGKSGTGIVSNHKVDHTFSQLADLGFNFDIGIGHVNKEGNTVFNQIQDTNEEYNISEVMSWFLTAFVDIAKDPYITKGNYNTYTASTAFMLLRAGTPISWINRFVGQPSIKKFTQLELNKKSRFNSLTETDSLEEAKKTYIDQLKAQHGEEKTVEKLGIIENMVNVKMRDNDNFSNKTLEKNITGESDAFQQLLYLAKFNKLKEYADSFEATVRYSKADVNGSPNTIVDNILYNQNRDDLMTKEKADGNDYFVNIQNKLNQGFLGTKHKNSVDLTGKIYKEQYAIARFLPDIIKTIKEGNGEFNISKNANKAANTLNSYIINQTDFFNLNKEESNYLLSADFQNKLKKAAMENPDNVLLQEFGLDSVDGLFFNDLDNISNKPNSFKNDLINAWKELHSTDTELSEQLIKYSYLTTGFQFGSKAFYEYIPASIFKSIVSNAYEEVKRMPVLPKSFYEYMYRHNPNLAYRGKEDLPSVDTKQFGNNLIYNAGDDTIGLYVTKSLPLIEGGYSLALYEWVGYHNDYGSVYKRVQPLGKNVGGRNIVEPSMDKESMFADNRFKESDSFVANYSKFKGEFTNTASYDRPRLGNLSGYNAVVAKIKSGELVNNLDKVIEQNCN